MCGGRGYVGNLYHALSFAVKSTSKTALKNKN